MAQIEPATSGWCGSAAIIAKHRDKKNVLAVHKELLASRSSGHARVVTCKRYVRIDDENFT
eukprot:9471175-Pyramimonas_sp.AAC.1